MSQAMLTLLSWRSPAIGILLLAVAGCGDENGVSPPKDTLAPGLVSDLTARAKSDSSIMLEWTAPGEDAASGTAKEYDFRYSTTALTLATEGGWEAATQIPSPAPMPSGTVQQLQVTGLLQRTTYYFALLARDEAGNSTHLSNLAAARTFERAPSLTLQWGGLGNGDGQFRSPTGLALDRVGGVVYVADPQNSRVEKFDFNGNFLDSWRLDIATENPTSMAVDPFGDLYIGSSAGGVRKYDSSGTTLSTLPGPGGNWSAVCTDLEGNVYISRFDGGEKCWIDKYDRSGTLLFSWATKHLPSAMAVGPGEVIYSLSNYIAPIPLEFKPRVQKFDSRGALLGGWDPFSGGEADCVSGIDVDPDGTIYISVGCLNVGTPRVLRFDSDESCLGSFRERAGGNDGFNPSGIAVDNQHNIYVLDLGGCRVEKFERDPSVNLVAARPKAMTR